MFAKPRRMATRLPATAAAAAPTAAAAGGRARRGSLPETRVVLALDRANALELQSQLAEALELSETLLREREQLIGERDSAMKLQGQNAGEVSQMQDFIRAVQVELEAVEARVMNQEQELEANRRSIEVSAAARVKAEELMAASASKIAELGRHLGSSRDQAAELTASVAQGKSDTQQLRRDQAGALAAERRRSDARAAELEGQQRQQIAALGTCG